MEENRRNEGMEHERWTELSNRFQTAFKTGDKETALKLYADYKRMMIEGSRDKAEIGCMESSLKEKGWLD